MQLSGVDQSTHLSTKPPHPTAAGLVLWDLRPGGRYRWMAARQRSAEAAPRQMQGVSRCQLMEEVEHKTSLLMVWSQYLPSICCVRLTCIYFKGNSL